MRRTMISTVVVSALIAGTAFANFALVKDLLVCEDVGFHDLDKIRIALTNTKQIYLTETTEAGVEHQAYFIEPSALKQGKIKLSSTPELGRYLQKSAAGAWQVRVRSQNDSVWDVECRKP